MELTFAQKENIGLRYVLDLLKPCSPFGQALVRDMTPMGPGQREELQRQLQNVRAVAEGESCRRELQQLLQIFMGLKMVRPTAQKCLETELNAIELFELKRFLLQTQQMLPLFARICSQLKLTGIALIDTTAALDILDPDGSRAASFYLADSVSPELCRLRREKRTLELQIREEAKPELLALRAQIAGEEELEEQRIHSRMSWQLRPHIQAMLANMEAIGDLDLTAEKARIARLYGGVAPTLTEDSLELINMTNPRISDLLAQQRKTFTPVSIGLERGAAVITGANMGGKSVALKTVALNVLLVHCGFFPFAATAKVPLFDGIHILSEDLESIDRGLSSFGGEMVRFSQMLQQMAQGFHFVILDEFARGTNPQEGAAIVRAVTQYLNRQNAISVLATHYDHVAEVASAHYRVAGLRDLNWDALGYELRHLSGQEGAARIAAYMNYGLYPVHSRQDCPRDALHICRLLGMPAEIVEDAEKTAGFGMKIC